MTAALAAAVLSSGVTSQTAKPVKPAAGASRAERKVPYAVGEKLAFDVSWSNYVSAGTLTLQVVAKRPSYSSTAYYITAEAQTQGVISKLYTLYYKADTLIDVFSMLPQRGSVYSREGRRQRTKITTFDAVCSSNWPRLRAWSKV